MIDCKLPRKLTIWLMKRVDCDNKCLVFRNRKVSIVHAVENLLKLPAADKSVPMPRPGRVRDKPFRGKTDFKSASAGRGESLKEATDRMLTYKEEKDKDKFSLCFMQVILCAYLAPTTGYQINRSYLLGALKDLSDIPRMNWCRFAAEYLIDAIRESRGNQVHNLNVGGCVHILHLIYVVLLKSDLVTILEGYPRIKYVGSAVLEQIDHTGKKRTQDHCKLFDSFLDNEKLAMFPSVEDNDDDIHDNDNSTHCTPQVTANTSTKPSHDKPKLQPKVVQTSKKRPADQTTDENLIKRIKKLEDQYTAERQKLITLSERKLQNKLQQLEIKKTNEMAALVQEEIQKAMLPMIDDARACSSLHNDEPNLTKGTVETESPCQSNLDEAVLLSAKSAQCVNHTTGHVDVIPHLSAGTTSSPTFINETVDIGTHESELPTNLVNNEAAEDDNLHRASSFLGQITRYEHSSSKQFTPTDLVLHDETAACKDPLLEICPSTTTAIARQDGYIANVVPASNIDAAPHQPEFISETIILTCPLTLPSNDSDQVQSHHVETEENNMPSEDSSMMNIVATDVQADISTLVPLTTNINGPGHGNTLDAPDSNSFAVQRAKQDSSRTVLHDVCTTVIAASSGDVIPGTAVIDPDSTKSSSQIIVCDAHKATENVSLSNIPASDVTQLEPAEKTTLEDEFHNQSNDKLENLDVSKNEIELKKDIEIGGTDATSKDVANICSPPLSIETVGDVSIMSVSQMTREYDRMNVQAAGTIHTTKYTASCTLHKVSITEDTEKLSHPEPIVLETSVHTADRSSISDVLHIDHSKLSLAMPKQSNETSDINLEISQTSPKESSGMQVSDQIILDQCVEMILGMSPNPPAAIDNNKSLSHAINEVLSENLEQTLALAEIATQCTAGDIEASSGHCTQQDVANVAQTDKTGKKEEQSQHHHSDDSIGEVSSERTEDDDISIVGKEDSDSHTSHLTPRHSFRDTEIVHIAEEPSSPKTIDCKHIPKLAEPLPDGECFDYAGSINPSMKLRKQRYQKKEEIAEGISELVKKKQYPVEKLNDLYNTLVASSKFRGLRKTRRRNDNETGGTKIRIGAASVTERELVQCLMPKGKMCKNMMWLLSVALMYDWGSKTKVILDQTIITELLKTTKKCNHVYLCKKISKLQLQNVEQIFLPTLSELHWILAVINITQNTIEIYDSNLEVKDGEDPHKVILDNMASNLQKALNDSLQKSCFAFTDFPKKYCYAGKQTNNDDCGFWVLKVLLCHNGKELIGNYKWAMDVFRKEICYILVYHRLNDLNPRRPEIKKIASSVKTTTN